MSTSFADLKADALHTAAPFPPLLAKAEQLAQTLMFGGHGRKRAGRGEEFWQYRPAQAGDPARAIDWRRSAQSDGHFIREHEWQAAQSLYLWCDQSASMGFSSHAKHPEKNERASVLTLALSMLLMQGGERVALMGLETPPQNGALHVTRIAQHLSTPAASTSAEIPEKISAKSSDNIPMISGCLAQSRAVFMSDFLGPLEHIEQALAQAADRGIQGLLYQVLDPAEEAFPYKGRTIFEALSGGVTYQTLRASGLRDGYLERLAERKDQLATLANAAGWQFSGHRTDHSAQSALLWLFQALEGSR